MQETEKNQLRQFVEQIERLEEDKTSIADDIRDKYTEAAGMGFDKKILRAVVSLRKRPKSEIEEEQDLIDTYLHALGMARDNS